MNGNRFLNYLILVRMYVEVCECMQVCVFPAINEFVADSKVPLLEVKLRRSISVLREDGKLQLAELAAIQVLLTCLSE